MKAQINFFVILFLAGCGITPALAAPKQVAGIYPHLTMYNSEGECGTGAVVPWAERLWVITYGPHSPQGSSDKLYEITPELQQIVRPESVGGTPANRMIHRESSQLNIGPYLIDAKRNVRVLDPKKMPGRLTGTARHLSDPENMIYIATMEEGLYSVNVHTMEFIEHIKDGNQQPAVQGAKPSKLTGYHGKGLYSGQGLLVYSNNGTCWTLDRGVFTDPTIPSGALASWQGSGDWTLIRQNQFTEVSGPGCIYGNSNPATDPLWSMGWDYRSLILMLLDKGQWHAYRLPKGSHSYDGSHGWNTEWPRIRDIGEEEMLGTMHGTFWRFPRSFSAASSAGIAPRSNYLKVIGDFARWKDRIVFGCDDSAEKEFLNTRPFKAALGAPVQSNSNLWFVEPEMLDRFGPAIGRGSVWLRDDLKAGQVSDPYLFAGYDYRMMTIMHGNSAAVKFTLEVDEKGNGSWTKLKTLSVDGSQVYIFKDSEKGAWVRVVAESDVSQASVHFHYRNRDPRSAENSALFDGVAGIGETAQTQGVIRSNRRVLSMLAEGGYYKLDDTLDLALEPDPANAAKGAALTSQGAQSQTKIRVDAASVIVEEDGRVYRIPKNDAYEMKEESGGANKELEEILSKSIAIGSVATATSTYGAFSAAGAVDGSIEEDSRWICSGPGRLTLDLGEEKSFRAVVIVTGWKGDAQYAASDFDVQVRHGGEWRTVPNGEIRGNRGIVVPVLTGEPVKARELSVLFHDSGYNRIYEVALLEEEPQFALYDSSLLRFARVCREVATERDLFNFHGTFYELPARNAQGFAKIRPVATHNLQIHDYASHFGLLFMTGLNGGEGERILRSSDGKTGLWAGAVDDLWQLGKPRGEGGVWKESPVKAGVPSDPYLMTAYDRKRALIVSSADATITLEVDIDGTELWVPYKRFTLKAGESIQYAFPEGFSAYWVRAVSSAETIATVMFKYD